MNGCVCGRDHRADEHRNLERVVELPDVVEVVTVSVDSGSTYDSGDPVTLTYHVAIEVYPTGDVWRWSLWSVVSDPWGGWTRGAWNPSGGMARTRDLALSDATTALTNHDKWTDNYGQQIPERFTWHNRTPVK